MLAQLPRFSKGQPARDALNAEFLNELIDAARRGGKVDTSSRNRGLGGTPPTTLVKVHNTTGDTLPFGAVIVTDGPAGDNAFDTDATAQWNFRRAPYFTAAEPAAATDQPLIVDRPIDDGAIGYAAIAGVAVTRIDVSDAGHLYAVPVVGEIGHLASAASGPVRILHKAPPDDGDIGWAVVLLGGAGGSGGSSQVVTTDAQITSTLGDADFTVLPGTIATGIMNVRFKLQDPGGFTAGPPAVVIDAWLTKNGSGTHFLGHVEMYLQNPYLYETELDVPLRISAANVSGSSDLYELDFSFSGPVACAMESFTRTLVTEDA